MRTNSYVWLFVFLIMSSISYTSYASDTIDNIFPISNSMPSLTVLPNDYSERVMSLYSIRDSYRSYTDYDVVSNNEYLLMKFPSSGHMRFKIRANKHLENLCKHINEYDAKAIADSYLRDTIKVTNYTEYQYDKSKRLMFAGSDESGNKYSPEQAGYYFVYQRYWKGYHIIQNYIVVYVNICGDIGELEICDSIIKENGEDAIISAAFAKSELTQSGFIIDSIKSAEIAYFHPGKRSRSQELTPVVFLVGENNAQVNSMHHHKSKLRFINLKIDISPSVIIDRENGNTMGRVF